MKKAFLLVALLAAASATCVAGNLPSGTLTVGDGGGSVAMWLNPTGYDFASNRHSLDLTYAGVPVVLSGTVDLSATAMPPTGQTSLYYFQVRIRDANGKMLQTTLNTDGLGGWRGIPAQPWDRMRIEQDNPLLGGPQLYFCTEGGQTDDGGGWIYPSDRVYDFEMITDPSAQTLSLRVRGKGRTNVDEKQWYDVGSMDVSAFGFDFAHTELFASLWCNGAACSASFADMNIAPIQAVPEPSSLLALAGCLVSLAAIRRRVR